jgi:hypothetical protein
LLFLENRESTHRRQAVRIFEVRVVVDKKKSYALVLQGL